MCKEIGIKSIYYPRNNYRIAENCLSQRDVKFLSKNIEIKENKKGYISLSFKFKESKKIRMK